MLPRTIISSRQHRPTGKAFLGDLHPTHRGRPDRLHPRAVYTGKQDQVIVYALKGCQVLGIKNIALNLFDDNPYRIAEPAQFVLVIYEVFDIRMTAGNHPFKAGIDVDVLQLVAQHQGKRRTQYKHEQSVVEDHALQPSTR
ncbi:hypothetical protein D3C85_681480 [compost metagenome]